MEKNYRIIEIKESVFKNNNERAEILRKELKEKKIFFLNLMSSPGSGKTTTLVALLNILKQKYKIGVMEADIDDDCDANTIQQKTGVKVIQLHTGGLCHLDSDMSRQGLDNLGIDNLDLVILENIGNLVCPAEFDTGSSINAMILSTPEGDDKPLKYPLIFQVSDLVIINKIDAMEFFKFDLDKVKERILRRNPKAHIIPISALHGDGVQELADYISTLVENWKNN